MTESHQQAKEPVSAALAGPYGHPFHPMLVTVPIGAWICSLVFDIAARVVAQPAALVSGARWLIGIGVIAALAAAAVGLLDFFAIPSATPAHRVAVVHMLLNLGITTAFAGNFLWRLDETSTTALGPLVLSVIGVAALGVSGALGGKLAYRYGVRVAAESVQAEGFRSATDRNRPDRAGSYPRQGE